RVVDELQRHGVDAAPAIVDVGTLTGAQQLMALAAQRFGRIDVLVNNVGGTIWIKPFHLYTEQQVHLELERSLLPTLWCCLAVLPVMMKQQAGSIVNIGSQSPRGIYRLPYAASKGGVTLVTARTPPFDSALRGVKRRSPRCDQGAQSRVRRSWHSRERRIAGRDRDQRPRYGSANDTAWCAGGRGSRGSKGLSALRARD